jgi:hypothetical protein
MHILGREGGGRSELGMGRCQSYSPACRSHCIGYTRARGVPKSAFATVAPMTQGVAAVCAGVTLIYMRCVVRVQCSPEWCCSALSPEDCSGGHHVAGGHRGRDGGGGRWAAGLRLQVSGGVHEVGHQAEPAPVSFVGQHGNCEPLHRYACLTYASASPPHVECWVGRDDMA